jgi:hypothetical protein
MNNKFRYDGTKKTILFFANSKYDSCTNAEYKTGQWCDVLINNPNINSVGCSYEINIGDKATLSFGGFKLLNQKHKIFKNLLCNFLPIKDATYNCTKIITPPIKSSIIADSTFGNFYSKEILAYDFGTYNQLKTIGGIFLFRKTKLSGQLLIIGSEQWLENNNFKNADLQTVTKNCVDLLM